MGSKLKRGSTADVDEFEHSCRLDWTGLHEASGLEENTFSILSTPKCRYGIDRMHVSWRFGFQSYSVAKTSGQTLIAKQCESPKKIGGLRDHEHLRQQCVPI